MNDSIGVSVPGTLKEHSQEKLNVKFLRHEVT